MTSVNITPEAELMETKALAEHYRNRNLILSQGLAEYGVIVAKLEARIAELEAPDEAADDTPSKKKRKGVH